MRRIVETSLVPSSGRMGRHLRGALAVALLCGLIVGCESGTAADRSAQDDEAAAATEREQAASSPGAASAAATTPAPAAQPADWCAGHGLPESKCTKCNPELAAEFQAAGDWCDAHGFPESACPTCNPQPPSGAGEASGDAAVGSRAMGGQVIRLKADDHEGLIGVETVPARAVSRATSLEVPGRLAFVEDRVADVRSLVTGLVREVAVQSGQTVEAGDTLFVLESASVGSDQGDAQVARARIRSARANVERQRELYEVGAVAKRKLEVAERELAEARAELSSARTRLEASQAAADGTVTLEAPLGGVVIERPGMLGTLATADASLATIVDTSAMWLWLDVPADRADDVEVGQSIAVRVEGVTGPRLESTIEWVAPTVDPRTRAVAARAVLENPDGRLRAHQYARAKVEISSARDAVEVPADAVQRLGEQHMVFVRTALGEYEPRKVTPGSLAPDGWQQVVGDVDAGEPVVSVGAFVLKTELSPESIGAGCCEAAE